MIKLILSGEEYDNKILPSFFDIPIISIRYLINNFYDEIKLLNIEDKYLLPINKRNEYDLNYVIKNSMLKKYFCIFLFKFLFKKDSTKWSSFYYSEFQEYLLNIIAESNFKTIVLSSFIEIFEEMAENKFFYFTNTDKMQNRKKFNISFEYVKELDFAIKK